MTSVSRPGDEVSIQVRFDDNRLLPLLYGEHDKNLARFERRLGVSLINRGNFLTISGPSDAVETARAAMDRLYRQIAGGRTIDAADIDAAMRMAEGGLNLPVGQEPSIQTRKKHILPRSPQQARYIEAMARDELVFGLGPAGTGKTYLAVAAAVAMLLGGKVDRIVLSRPAVEAGERLGFLPGDMREKVDPYLRPLYDALNDTMAPDQVARRIETGEIEIAPLAFMRGRTLANAFVILDEAQNTTPMQMKMALTRLGENSRMVVTGDLTQIDLPPGQPSGLRDALETVEGLPGIGQVTFTDADVVRHPLVARIVRAYAARAATRNGSGGA